MAGTRPHRARSALLPAVLASLQLTCLQQFTARTPASAAGPRAHAAPPPALPPMPPSRVELPIDLDLHDVAAAVERRVPASVDRTATWTMVADGRVGLKFRARRAPIALAMAGEALRGRLDISYAIEACVRLGGTPARPAGRCVPIAECGMLGAERHASLAFASALSWTSDWRLAAHTTVEPIQFGDACRVGPARTDVSRELARLLEPELRRVVAQLDARLLDVADARAPAERVWLALQEPVELQPRAWLRVAPGSIEAGPITGDADRLHTTLTLTGHPFVQIGPRPRVVPKPLPSLGVAPGGEGGFHVVLDAELPVREATALLDRELRGRTFRVGIRPMKVLGASVFVRGADTGVALDVQFHAGLFRRPRGRLTVLGTLRYDPATRALWLDQPRLSLESKALLRLAAVEMFGGTIDHLVQEKARFPIGDRIDRLRRQLAEALSRQLAPIARLETRVDSLRAVGVYTRGDVLVGRVEADGRATVQVTAPRPG